MCQADCEVDLRSASMATWERVTRADGSVYVDAMVIFVDIRSAVRALKSRQETLVDGR